MNKKCELIAPWDTQHGEKSRIVSSRLVFRPSRTHTPTHTLTHSWDEKVTTLPPAPPKAVLSSVCPRQVYRAAVHTAKTTQPRPPALVWRARFSPTWAMRRRRGGKGGKGREESRRGGTEQSMATATCSRTISS
ncbi:hypothetical protein LZ32DRAFT_189313 [Colletotrichum eremochloae]|nr:hypothetical protein LZ32DRAFT_189313 [Colletotrichum eremochloae]